MIGDEFISLAGKLCVNPHVGDAEARYRTAVSRAYYGAFHLAVDFLENELGESVARNYLAHQFVYRGLFGCGDDDARHAARLLNDLRAMRNDADYDSDEARFRIQATAEESVVNAHDVRSSLDACRKTCQDETVREGLKQGIAEVKKLL
jgi:uncharacterized protein (UPF0332 family)